MASYLDNSPEPESQNNADLLNPNCRKKIEFSSGMPDNNSRVENDGLLKVFLRVKPLNTQDPSDALIDTNYKITGRKLTTTTINNKSEVVNSTFSFSEIFWPTTSQETIFEHVVIPRLKEFFQGGSSLLFSYGTTSSGKSYTMQGTSTAPGIIPRVLYNVFNTIKGHEDYSGLFYPEGSNKVCMLCNSQMIKNQQYKLSLLQYPITRPRPTRAKACQIDDTISCVDAVQIETALSGMKKLQSSAKDEIFSVWISFCEVYNEIMYDLFVPECEKQPLTLAEDKSKKTYVKGLKYINVQSWQEAYDLYKFGKNNLHVSHTTLNKKSSRSHCLLEVKLISRSRSDNSTYNNCSSFAICDLAGSERQQKAGNAGEMRTKEAQNINQSLVVLNRCLDGIRKNQRIKGCLRVPFRDSKLTRLFKDLLIGEGRVGMIANMSQEMSLFSETQAILKMTAHAAEITIADWVPPERRVVHPKHIKPTPQDAKSSLLEEELMRTKLELEETKTKLAFCSMELEAAKDSVASNEQMKDIYKSQCELDDKYRKKMERELFDAIIEMGKIRLHAQAILGRDGNSGSARAMLIEIGDQFMLLNKEIDQLKAENEQLKDELCKARGQVTMLDEKLEEEKMYTEYVEQMSQLSLEKEIPVIKVSDEDELSVQEVPKKCTQEPSVDLVTPIKSTKKSKKKLLSQQNNYLPDDFVLPESASVGRQLSPSSMIKSLCSKKK